MQTRPPARPAQRWTAETIERVHYWCANLCTVWLSKPLGFQFSPGHYVRLALPSIGDNPVCRPYSLVSSPEQAQLEFLVTLIPNGAFTSQLSQLGLGDSVLVESAVMGFFLEPQLAAGESLWLLATGSGIGPYIALLRQAEVFQRYQRILLLHSVRFSTELSYADELRQLSQQRPSLTYLPIVTRDTETPGHHQRLPEALNCGELESSLGLNLNADQARVMVCGNPAFSQDMRALLTQRGFIPCRRGLAGSMLFENYW